jgi:hypothetical protein|tara:strand:+ start:363 stop:602 length:240 start_codon:yes stop_codon:yes gene_type:complete
MSEYWDGLMNWNCEGYQANKKREKMVEYDTPMKGQKYIQECKEQIQEDIICYVEATGGEEENADALCQIVVDNFKKLEK